MSKFYEEIYKMKTILRKGWLRRKVSDTKANRVESDAEIMTKKNLKLDQLKVLKMALVHDLCEIDAGDSTPFDNITPEQKHNLELKCMKRLSVESQMPEILDLWKEFEENKTPEAIFVKKVDKLDAILQSKVYSEIMNDNNKLFDEYFDYEPTKPVTKEFENFIK